MSDQDPNLSMLVGEMKGQLRELIHGQNNLSVKVDALGKEMGPIAALAVDVADLKRRVGVLEVVNSERRGAANIVGATMRSPVVGWIVAAAVAVGGYVGWEHQSEAQPAPARTARPMGGQP